jgi:hypothetical protein
VVFNRRIENSGKRIKISKKEKEERKGKRRKKRRKENMKFPKENPNQMENGKYIGDLLICELNENWSNSDGEKN